MTDIVITEFMDEGAVARLRAAYDVHHDPDLYARPAEIAARVAGAPALIVRNQTRVTRAVLDAASRLVVVGRLGVGLDNIDLETCVARGIAVIPATGANAGSVVEYVLGTAMALARGAYHANAAMLAGAFPKTALIGREIAGRRLGLVGYGRIARDLAVKASALGMSVAATERGGGEADGVARLPLDALLAGSDIVSLHVPLTPETRGLIGAERIARMRPGAILIDTSRGGIVDVSALARALRSGHLGGAAIDVHEEEPLSARAAAVFADCPNLILTPHIAGNTVESNARVSGMVADGVLRVLAGTDAGRT